MAVFIYCLLSSSCHIWSSAALDWWATNAHWNVRQWAMPCEHVWCEQVLVLPTCDFYYANYQQLNFRDVDSDHVGGGLLLQVNYLCVFKFSPFKLRRTSFLTCWECCFYDDQFNQIQRDMLRMVLYKT